MRLNPYPSRFFVSHSELYEQGTFSLRAKFPHIDPLLVSIEDALKKTPHLEGEVTSAFAEREFRVHSIGRTAMLPGVRVLYEIADPRVVCWAIAEKSPPGALSGGSNIIPMKKN